MRHDANSTTDHVRDRALQCGALNATWARRSGKLCWLPLAALLVAAGIAGRFGSTRTGSSSHSSSSAYWVRARGGRLAAPDPFFQDGSPAQPSSRNSADSADAADSADSADSVDYVSRPRSRRAVTSTSSSSAPQFLSLQFSQWNDPSVSDDDSADSVRVHVAIGRALFQLLCTETPELAAVQNEEDAPDGGSASWGDAKNNSWTSSDKNACLQFASYRSANSDGSSRHLNQGSFLQSAQAAPLFGQPDAGERSQVTRDATAVVQSKEKGPGSEKAGNLGSETDPPSSIVPSDSDSVTAADYSVLLADPYTSGQEKSDEVGHSWTVWTATYKVLNVGDYYRQQVVAAQSESNNGTGKSDNLEQLTSGEGGADLAALEIMRQLIQTALDVSLGEGRFDFALQQVVPREMHSSPVGQEAERFADLPVQTIDAPPKQWTAVRIAGIAFMAFIILACFVFAFLAFRRSQQLLKHPQHDDTSTGNEDSVDIYVPESGGRLESQAASSVSRLSKSYCFHSHQEDMCRMVAPPTILHLPTGPGGLLDSSANMEIDSSDDDRSVLSPITGFLLCRKRESRKEEAVSALSPKKNAVDTSEFNSTQDLLPRSKAFPIPESSDEIEIDVDTGELLGVSKMPSSSPTNGVDAPTIAEYLLVDAAAQKKEGHEISRVVADGDDTYNGSVQQTETLENKLDADSISSSPSSTTENDTVFDGKSIVLNNGFNQSDGPPNETVDSVLQDVSGSDDPGSRELPVDLQHCASNELSDCAAVKHAATQEASDMSDFQEFHHLPSDTDNPLHSDLTDCAIESTGSIITPVHQKPDELPSGLEFDSFEQAQPTRNPTPS